MKIGDVNLNKMHGVITLVLPKTYFLLELEWMYVIYIHRLHADRLKMGTFSHNIHEISAS